MTAPVPPPSSAGPPQAARPPAPPDPWSAWLATPAGRYLLAWEQDECDERVVNIFGFNALQCGTPQLQALQHNRMPLRCVVLDAEHLSQIGAAGAASAVLTDQFEALPFASQSIDLLVLPHVLEFSGDPHQLLREAERVLRPEGRVLILGLNPFSLWGARHMLAGWFFKARLPANARMISLSRLRDWLSCSRSRSSGSVSAATGRCRAARRVRDAVHFSKAWAIACGRCAERCIASPPSSVSPACA